MVTKVLILAGDTDGNLGDLALVTATVEQLRRIDPQIRITLVTSRPERDRARLGIIPVARGWRGIVALIRAARSADLVICGGGGLFQDDDSLVKMPYWALRLMLVRLVAARMAGLSIGAGPLDHAMSRLFARLAVRTLDPMSVRDAEAHAALAPLTRRRIDIIPDPAFMLPAADNERARQFLLGAGIPADGTPLIGVAVRRWFHTSSDLVPHKYAARFGLRRNRGRQEMAAFIDNTAAALDRAAAAAKSHVVFMPTYNAAHEDDLAVCRSVANRMQTRDCSFLHVDDPKLYKAITGFMSVMLCGRMHPAILCAGQGTRAIGLAYNRKFFGAFSLLGQRHRCLSMRKLVEPDGAEELSRMLLCALVEPAEPGGQSARLAERTRHFIESLLARAPARAALQAARRTQQ